MNVKGIRMIIAIAVAMTIAVAGVVSASPPVPAPNETAKIVTSVNIECIGTVSEVESLKETHTTQNLSDKILTDDERVGQIEYTENMKAVDGVTSFMKDFTFDGSKAPNLGVEKRLSYYITNTSSPIAWVDVTENAGLSIVSEGDNDGPGGMEGLCVWQSDVCIPPTNEMVAEGSQLSRVTYVTAQTKTAATTTDSPRLHHEIDARGISDETGFDYGRGTVKAGMKVSTMEGTNCSTGYPLAGRTTYSEMTSASGAWKFSKSMTYTSKIPSVGLPRTYPVFQLPA